MISLIAKTIYCQVMVLTLVSTQVSEAELEQIAKSWHRLADAYDSQFSSLESVARETGKRKVEGVFNGGVVTTYAEVLRKSGSTWLVETRTEIKADKPISAKPGLFKNGTNRTVSSAKASNDVYSFEVKSEDEKWSVQSLSGSKLNDKNVMRSGGLYLSGSNLPLFLLLPKYGLFRQVEAGNVSGQQATGKTFKLIPIDPFPQNVRGSGFEIEVSATPIESVSVTVEEKSEWVPTKVVTNFTNRGEKAESILQIGYDVSSFAVPVPNAIELSVISESLESRVSKSMTFKNKDLDDERFKLSHYGLPEPSIDIESNWFSTILWTTVGTLMFFIGLLLYRSGRNGRT